MYKREWKSKSGRGDLVLTDGQVLFAVIEVKHIGHQISSELKRQKHKKLKDQACKYGQEFADKHPLPATVLAGSFTEVSASVNWVELPCQKLAAVRLIADAAASTKPSIRCDRMLDRLVAPSADQSPLAVPMTALAARKPLLPRSDEQQHNQPGPDQSDNLCLQSVFTMPIVAQALLLTGGGLLLYGRLWSACKQGDLVGRFHQSSALWCILEAC